MDAARRGGGERLRKELPSGGTRGKHVADPRDAFYAQLLQELRGLLEGQHDLIANAANTVALLFQRLDDVNWVGFYRMRGGELIVGPFQGKPACVRIASGKGVCGAAVAEKRSLVVPDVHAFPGHIACDDASRSEVVVPLLDHESVVGVLDIDSPSLARFDTLDAKWLGMIVAVFLELTDVDAS